MDDDAPYFTQQNTHGHSDDELAELNRQYEERLSTYSDPDGEIRTSSDPHFFNPVPIRLYVAWQILMEFEP